MVDFYVTAGYDYVLPKYMPAGYKYLLPASSWSSRGMKAPRLPPHVTDTTAVAARNTGRHFLCCDASPDYVAAANLRLQNSDPMQASVLPNGMKQRSLFES